MTTHVTNSKEIITNSGTSAVASDQNSTVDKAAKARELIFTEPNGFGDRILYEVATMLAYPFLYACPKFLVQMTHHHKVTKVMEKFFRDLGGEAVSIKTDHGHVLKGFYLNAGSYAEKHQAAFTKWKPKLLNDRQMSEYLGLKKEGKTVLELFNLPRVEQSEHIRGAVICNGAKNLYQCDPQLPLMYLARNISVLVWNYGGVFDSDGSNPNGKTTNLDGDAATKYLKNKLNCENEKVLVHGKSLGSSVAAFVGTQHPGALVLVDRGFCAMDEIAKAEIPGIASNAHALGAIQKFYPFPTTKLLEYVTGSVLLIRAREDEMMGFEHTQALEKALVAAKKPEDKEAFLKAHSITAPGKHSGVVWYNDMETQKALSRFIDKKD